MNEFIWGDAIFQLVLLISLVVIIALIVLAIRTFSKRFKQMDRIEKKLDSESQQAKKNN